jgi:hypothetical protein
LGDGSPDCGRVVGRLDVDVDAVARRDLGGTRPPVEPAVPGQRLERIAHPAGSPSPNKYVSTFPPSILAVRHAAVKQILLEP